MFRGEVESGLRAISALTISTKLCTRVVYAHVHAQTCDCNFRLHCCGPDGCLYDGDHVDVCSAGQLLAGASL